MPLLTLITAAALAANPAAARFTFVDAFGPEEPTAPHYRPLTLATAPPRPLVGAPAPGKGISFALVHVGAGVEAGLGVVWQADAPGGPVLWLDADGDGQLDPSERHPFSGKTLELTAQVRVGSAVASRTLVFRRGRGAALYVAVRGFTRGRLVLGGKEYAAALTDGDADGCFDTAGSDRVWIDLNQDGVFDPLTEQFPLGTALAVGGQLFLIRPDPTGTEVQVRVRGNDTGRLRASLPLQPGAKVRDLEATLVSEFGELTVLRALDPAVALPAGSYRVEALTVRAADAAGRLWAFRFQGQRQFSFRVEAGKETRADLLDGLALTTGVTKTTVAPDGAILVAVMWQSAAEVYLAECTVDGACSGADVLLTDAGGKILHQTASGFA